MKLSTTSSIRACLLASLLFSAVFSANNVSAKPTEAAAVNNGKAASQSTGVLVNEAGRLRMLSERMGKAYLQLSLNLMPDAARQQIIESQQRFQENLQLLSRAQSNATQQARLTALADDFRSFTRLLAQEPNNKANVLAVNLATEQLVEKAEQLTQSFASQGNQTAEVVNLAGRQRMFSQRLARWYFNAQYLEQKVGKNQVEIAKLSETFKKVIATLETKDINTADIQRELEVARVQWFFFEQALNGEGDLQKAAKNVATTNERLLETMDTLTALYSKAVRPRANAAPQ